MNFQFRPCTLEMDYEAYFKFLIKHHAQLNLPYPFATKVSFISSPLMFGKAMLIIEEESYQIVGAAGFVYGTGLNDYEDRHVCQVEVAFIQQAFRRTSLFVQGLQALVDMMKAGESGLKQVRFWTSLDDLQLNKLFSKFLALPGSTTYVENSMMQYDIPYRELEKYSQRFGIN